MESIIQALLINAIPVVFAITLHEAAHGYVARHFGDQTAARAGRISLNPLRHIDPFGTIILPGLILALSKLAGGSGLLFGWAKPVPVNFSALRNPKRDMLWVAAAGPGSNLVMAVAWALLWKASTGMADNASSEFVQAMALAGIEINSVLMVLNLLPILPLDGGRILVSLLPFALATRFARLERFGFPIMLLLLFSGVLGLILTPLMHLFVGVLARTLNI